MCVGQGRTSTGTHTAYLVPGTVSWWDLATGPAGTGTSIYYVGPTGLVPAQYKSARRPTTVTGTGRALPLTVATVLAVTSYQQYQK